MWLRGLVAAFINGGATAIVAGPVAAMLAPTELNLNEGLSKLLTLIGTIFFASGVMGAASYLKSSPLPEVVVEDTAFVEKPKE